MWVDWASMTTERCIEIPVFFETLAEFKPKTVLDVGFAGGWYHRDVVELGIDYVGLDATPARASGAAILVGIPKRQEWAKSLKDIEVVPQDIVDWKSDRTFEMVACISTLEHIIACSYGMRDRGPDADLDAVKKMKTHVAPGGTLFLTFPVGINVKEGPLDPKTDFAPYGADRIAQVVGDWNVISERYWSDLDGTWEPCSIERATTQPYPTFRHVRTLGVIHLSR